MYAFTYHRPSSLAEAAQLLRSLEDPKLLSGGQTLLPTLKMRLARPSDLIDIGRLAELKGLARQGDNLVIGAATRHAEVAGASEVRQSIPALANLASQIGDPAVRHMGTLGGSVANNDPTADYPAACLGLNATIETNTRKIAAGDFFKGLFETALAPGEIVVRVAFPIPKRAAYLKFRNPASRYAIVGVFVADTGSGPRVAVTGAGAGVFRVEAMEKSLAKSFAPEAVANIRVPADDLNSDLHATAEYRAHLIGVLARRAVTKALS